ncbi:MAG: hypothetical protein D8M58_02305 [Calditrichaeota bacterium]|nr:MAG: hypothetical protein DWQ03_04775 [Calditrichota bacterium]MBL1204196.1 hypothetical protein [Calditrichota bacterium]NOG44026.1 hypothetical protein [Calditrichota bacterium]
MDLSKKLTYYKKSPEKEKLNHPPSLIALKDHYHGEILFDEAPILKIQKRHPYPDYKNDNIHINLISKNEFTDPIRREKCVFFDLETTGLAGGTGTFAFLIGFAYWQNEEIITDQYFLPDFGREYEIFNVLQDWLSGFEYLVSYNGKSYDMPLLSSRFILNRLKPGFKNRKHIDLIHMCRRIWKESLPSCDLKSIEQHLLNVHRTGDIPGAFIPQAYFNFINTGAIHDVLRMIEHNLQDILSLTLFLDQLDYLNKSPQKLPLDSKAVANLAKTAFQAGDTLYFEMIENSEELQSKISIDYKYWKSLLLKRSGKLDDANKIWEELLTKPEYCFFSLEESAKYHEHRKKDLPAALNLVEEAFKRLDLQAELGYQIFDPSWKTRFEKRRNRLKNKLSI